VTSWNYPNWLRSKGKISTLTRNYGVSIPWFSGQSDNHIKYESGVCCSGNGSILSIASTYLSIRRDSIWSFHILCASDGLWCRK
jgi:hypothetical protein